MAFVACEEVAQMCRGVGTRVIGLVGAPYLGGGINDHARCEKLGKASDDTVARMIGSGCPVILDEGFWGGSGGVYDPIKWHWHQKDNPVWVITQAIQCQYTDVFERMVASTSRLNFNFAIGHSAAEAIQEAIAFDWEWTTGLDGESRTASGAVICVIGDAERIDSHCAEVLTELENPDQFRRKGLAYWRDDAKFIVIARSEDWGAKENAQFVVEVLSTGVKTC